MALAGGWLALLAAFLLLALAVEVVRPFPGDVGITRELQEGRPLGGVIRSVMTGLSVFGYSPWAELTVVVPAVALILAGRRRAALLIILATAGDLVNQGMKLAFERPRPAATEVMVLQRAGGYSFPSGHVVHYVVLFGAVVYIALAALASEGRPPVRAAWAALAAVCLGLILGVGPSRIYLGAHWASDVVAGYLFGAAWLLAAVWWVYSRPAAQEQRQPPPHAP